MKKLLCALLAAVLTLTLMIPCTATDFAGFSDQQEIENNNAVRMLYDLGLISGYSDGSFGPQNPIRREEVAKLMALLCEAEPQAQNASAPFYDSTTAWAVDY
ncbi:MAG: S-layer homology domain-containing protein, partial [Oscillospiraceae bacterium]